MKRSYLERFMNPNASPEHRSAVEALCVDLDPNSDLYKCLLQTTNTQEIDKCFQQYSNKTGNAIITSSMNQEEENNGINGNSKCPPTQMKHDGKEYIIDTHPNIGRWGLPNPICPGKFLPDHEAQKHGMLEEEVRCKDIGSEYVSKKKYDELQKKYTSCQQAFNMTKCENSFYENTSLVNDINASNLAEAFQTMQQSEDNELSNATLQMNQNTPQNLTVGTKPFGNFSITNHKQFQEIIKDYTPNNELPKVCNAYVEDNLSQYPIERHRDINKYVLKTSIPAPKRCRALNEFPIVAHQDIVNYVHKDSIPTPKNLEDYDINEHPDINNYILKSTIPAPKRCKTLGEYKLEQHPEFAAYKKQMEDKCNTQINKFSQKDKCGNVVPCKKLEDYDITQHPDYKNKLAELGIKQDKCGTPVKCITKCPTPDPENIKDHPDYQSLLKQFNIQRDQCGKPKLCSKINENEYKELNSKYDYTQTLLKKQQDLYKNLLEENNELKNNNKELQDGCALNFINRETGQSYNYENMVDYAEYFTNPEENNTEKYQNSEETKENSINGNNNLMIEMMTQGNKDTENETPKRDPWDIRNHKDFDRFMEDYISKEECGQKYGVKDKCGKIIPCKEPEKCKDLKDFDITDHPDYEKVLLKFGALKTNCGKLIPAPKCPCIVKDKCGKYKYKPCPPQKKCAVCKEMKKEKCEVKGVQTELVKSKIKLDLMITKYKELLSQHKQAQSSLVKQQRENIQKQIKQKKALEQKRSEILSEMEVKQNEKLADLKKRFDNEIERLKKELMEKNELLNKNNDVLKNKEIQNKKLQENNRLKENENKKLQEHNKMVLSKYNQHLKDKTGKSTCSFDRNSTLPRASENKSGWVYRNQTTTELSDEKNKFYHPSGVNYRMLENK